MDVFVTLAQAKLDLKGSCEECSWLQALFQVVFDSIYKSTDFSVSCEEVCLQILHSVMSLNGNMLPTNHVVLSVKDLFNFANNTSFSGKVGNAPEMVKSSQSITDYAHLQERSAILLGYLTGSPRSKATLIPGTGLLYLEDEKNAVICQVCQPEKHLLNSLVLLPKWNFIPCPKFPVVIFEGDTAEAAYSSKFGYIEVVQDCISICRKNPELQSDIPKSISVREYSEIESQSEKINLRGCLRALSPIHRFMPNNSKGKPFFLAQFECTRTQYSTVVVFQGEKFTHWHNFLAIGETYVISNLLETTMNKGQQSERRVLAATRRSDFFKEQEQPNFGALSESVSSENDGPSEAKKRKRDEETQDGEQTAHVEKLKEKWPVTESPTRSIGVYSSKSETFSCSPPMAYRGVITGIINVEAGVYEIDNRMKLYTHYQPCTNFGCGLRVGALVFLHNVHLCKLDQKVLGFCCCTYSTIRIAQHSQLASPFKALVPSMSYFYHICQRFSLVQFVCFLDLVKLLIKKFKSTLSQTDIVGPKKVLRGSSPPQPTLLSNIVNLESLSSSSSRDIYKEFFGQPHCCLVSRPSRNRGIPKPETLADLVNLIDRLRTQESERSVGAQQAEMREPYGWKYRAINEDELPEDMILVGWLSCCRITGQLCLCDQTAKIPCLITEAERSKTIHKCSNSCLSERKSAKPVIVANAKVRKIECPLAQTSHFGAILRVNMFKIIVETFVGQELHSGETRSSSENLAKHYLVFSLRHTTVIGNIPGMKTLGISSDQRKEKVSQPKEISENSERRFVFLLKCKELRALNLKDNNPSFTSCIQGYFLAEVKQANGEDVRLETFKKSVIIRFEKDCSSLTFLHPGCFYYVTDRCFVGKTSRILKAIDIKGMCPVVDMSSSVWFEQIDERLSALDVYDEWVKLSEKNHRVSGVRESLSMQNKPEEDDVNGSNYQGSLVSFRGVIVNRENVFSNQSDENCPFPTIPRDKLYLPHYGLISRSQAHALSLGFCFLGIRQLVLTVRDVETADTVKVYIDLSTRSYPWGLLPGAVVTFFQVSNHISRKGNVYFSFMACSDILVESIPFGSTTVDKASKVSRVLPATGISQQPDPVATQVCNIIDFSNSQKGGEVIQTVAYVLCRVTAVQKIVLKWTCSKCGKLAKNCYCFTAGGNQTWMFTSQARCLVEDGTCEAMLFAEDDQVRDLLLLSEASWNEIKNLSKTQDEVWFKRSAYWKNGDAGGDTRADKVLSNIASSPCISRRIKILCKQFRMNSSDNLGLEKEHETRNITVDRKEHSTYVLPKVTLNVLEIKEINCKEEANKLLNFISRNVKI